MPLTLIPELTYVDGELRRELKVTVGDDGRIQAVGGEPVGEQVRLPRKALFPGLVNAHSHAFQRLLRGATQWRGEGGDGQPDDFWSWRARMYAVAGSLTPDELEDVSAFAFLEMARAGITAVGEFHYLHRDPAGHDYADPNELSLRVVRAAERVGLRITLLRVAYARGGAGEPLSAAQRRFGLLTVDHFIADTEALERTLASHVLARVGIAPHSVRALHRDQLQALAHAVSGKAWPVHMHVSEQPREVDGCVAETGLRPVVLAAESGLLDARFCAIHAIHLSPSEVELLGVARAHVCACPTTERDLGDGVVPADALREAGVTLALGTDSQAQIDLLEEARALELNLRMVQRKRLVLVGAPVAERGDGGTVGLAPIAARGRHALARGLFATATVGGSRALGLPDAVIAKGAPGDLIAVDLDDPSLAGSPLDLVSILVFGGQTRAIADVFVGGRRVISAGHHAAEAEISARFMRVAARF